MIHQWQLAGLGAEVLEAKRTFQLTTPGGSNLPSETRIVARGSAIHALIGDTWLSIDLADVPD